MARAFGGRETLIDEATANWVLSLEHESRFAAMTCALAHERRLVSDLLEALSLIRVFGYKPSDGPDMISELITRAEGVPLGVESAMASPAVGAGWCPVCNGNAKDVPCCYPSEGRAGCMESRSESVVVGAEVRAAHGAKRRAEAHEVRTVYASGTYGKGGEPYVGKSPCDAESLKRFEGPLSPPLSRVRTDGK